MKPDLNASGGILRASGRPRTACLPRTKGMLCQMSYRGIMLPDRTAQNGTGTPPVKSGNRCSSKSRTWSLLGQNQAGLPIPLTSIAYARRELNPQTATFEVVSFTS